MRCERLCAANFVARFQIGSIDRRLRQPIVLPVPIAESIDRLVGRFNICWALIKCLGRHAHRIGPTALLSRRLSLALADDGSDADARAKAAPLNPSDSFIPEAAHYSTVAVVVIAVVGRRTFFFAWGLDSTDTRELLRAVCSIANGE